MKRVFLVCTVTVGFVLAAAVPAAAQAILPEPEKLRCWYEQCYSGDVCSVAEYTVQAADAFFVSGMVELHRWDDSVQITIVDPKSAGETIRTSPYPWPGLGASEGYLFYYRLRFYPPGGWWEVKEECFPSWRMFLPALMTPAPIFEP